MHNGLIPSDLPFKGLMRIGNEPGLAIGHFGRRKRKGIGPIHIGLPTRRRHGGGVFSRSRLTAGERANDAIKAIEKGRAQDKARHNILARHRKQLWQAHFAPVLGSIMVQPGSIAFHDFANIGWHVGIISVGRAPGVQ